MKHFMTVTYQTSDQQADVFDAIIFAIRELRDEGKTRGAYLADIHRLSGGMKLDRVEVALGQLAQMRAISESFDDSEGNLRKVYTIRKGSTLAHID